MPTFGFSAFLKLISLNPKPQRRVIRERLLPSKEGGYDFHRSLRLHAHRFLVDKEPMESLLSSADLIAKDAEKKSVIQGLETLDEWRSETPGKLFEVAPRIFESPAGLFKIAYQPNFGIELPTGRTAVHLWNTKSIALDRRLTYAALSLFPELYLAAGDQIDDFSVLSLHEPTLIRLNEVPDQSILAERLVAALEKVFLEVQAQLKAPGAQGGADSSLPPPPF